MLRTLFLLFGALAMSGSGAARPLGGGSDLPSPAAAPAATAPQELRVLQLNIWHDASAVPGAFEALVERIVGVDAHIVALCEVSNHDGA
ncbi:MAG: hypothetical protein K2N93_00580, partial [Alistipes sp.]|nr:hypothetical protein [Alistipes sp.]